jgi:tetratricopeptide (TPR) repeat protein
MTLTAMMVLATVVGAGPLQATEPASKPDESAASGAQAAESPSVQEATAGAAEDAIEAGLDSFARRRYRKAAEQFREALTADPNSAAAAFYLGYSLYKIAEPTARLTPEKREAAEMFAKAFDLDPEFRPVWAKK